MLRDYLIGGALLCAVVAVAFYAAFAGMSTNAVMRAQVIAAADSRPVIQQPKDVPSRQAAQSGQSAHDLGKPTDWERFWSFTTHDAAGFYTFILCAFTAVLAGATIGLWIATYRLWRSTREHATEQLRLGEKQAAISERQRAIAEQQFLATNRPKVRIKGVWFKRGSWNASHAAISLSVVNSGTLDATINRILVRAIIMRRDHHLPAPPEIPEASAEFKPYVVPPGTTYYFSVLQTPQELTDHDRANLRGGDFKLYCLGEVHYTGGADGLRIVSFCRVLDVPSIPESMDIGQLVKHSDPNYEFDD